LERMTRSISARQSRALPPCLKIADDLREMLLEYGGAAIGLVKA
jgi:hypothetical protein